jgi:hypothetical protein
MYEPLIKKEWPRNIELSYVSTDVQTLSHDFINQKNDDFYFLFLLFNATFSNISAISWRSVLVVEEAGVLEENHRPWASNW